MLSRFSSLFVALGAGVAVVAWFMLAPDPPTADGAKAPRAAVTPSPPATDPEPLPPAGEELFADIGGLEKGGTVRLPLPGGETTVGRLNYVSTYPNGATAAGGVLEDGSGTFEIACEPWGHRGFILQREKNIAHVYSSGPGGPPQVARRPVGEVICEPDPEWEPLAQAPGPDPEKAAIYNGGRSVGIIYEPIPQLSSLPRAAATIYLDFDGEVIEGHSWEGGTRIVAPAYNLPAGEVTEMWRRVAEDFAPFEVNVTTDLQTYLRAPQGLRIRCITTTNNFAGAGGVAFNNTFRQSGEPVCWNFYRGNAGALVISHEVGHTFGLHHDGQGDAGYYGGHGSGSMSWGPIMGSPYNQNVCHWSKGDYVNANQQQDDLIMIGSSVPRRMDDHSSLVVQATPLVIGAGGAASNAGVIASPDDIDRFVFGTGGGSLNLRFDPASGSPNLDIEVKLYDSFGSLVATASPANQMNATLSRALAAGIYTVTVDGIGNGSWATNGYDDYGSLGEYTITGSVPSPAWIFRVPANALAGATLGDVLPGGSGYSITGGNTGGAFVIQASTGVLRVANPATLSWGQIFNLTVAHSGGSVPVEVRVATPAGLKQEIWTGLGGNGIGGLISSPDYPDNPDLTKVAPTFQTNHADDNYGQKLSGHLVPTETGGHVFWSTADDASELWLSTDSNPANKARIAWNTSNTGPDSWDQQGTQQSSPVTLVAGERYYIEQLHREQFGGDHVNAVWQTPTQPRQLISTDHLEYPGAPENRPPWIADMTFRVREDSSRGSVVGSLEAGDHEAGSKLSSFSITGGNIGNAFALNPVNGTLTVNTTLSFATRHRYFLDVRATDSGGLQTTAQIAIEIEPRSVKREFWAGIGGNPVGNLTSSPSYPDNPTSATYEAFFETPTNTADNYGQRLSGYLRAPDSGSYTFWIASDDGGELWLSTDHDPASKTRIAWHDGATGPREWGKFTTQRSSAVTLEAGRFYYIEALHKEGIGGDNLAVSWSGPDFGQVMLGTPHVTQQSYNHGAPVLDDRTVAAFDRDTEIATLEAKDWADPGTKVTYAITGGNADGAFTIDPDSGTIRATRSPLPTGDRVLTVTATDNGPTPMSGTAAITVQVAKAGLKREVWTGLAGGQGLGELTGSLDYPRSPDETGYTQHFQSPTNQGDNYGQRLSGYLNPPATGDYIFWVASDDSSQLLLSTDANPSNKRPIAGVNGAVGNQNWAQQGGQQSAMIRLVAGQRYYIEALHKEGGGGDHLAAAWQGPGFPRTLINNAYLEYPDTYRPALKREVWPGNSTLAPAATPPGFVGTLMDFKGPVDTAENFSERITGYIIPPVTGSYTFWLASDDDGALRLSTDEDPANLATIATVTGFVAEEAWDASPSQKSAPRTLTAGKRYHVEVLHRDGVFGDHVAVAWEGPSLTRRLIANEHLEHPAAPADRSLPMRERWNGIAGGNLSDLLDHSSFPVAPSAVDTLPSGVGLAAPDTPGDNYGQRISAYLRAPEHGRYTFWIASDDASELWLSTDGNPANRIRLATVSGHVAPRDWDAQPGQQSVPVGLEAGRRYHLEVLHKESDGDDHLAVAWQGPGFARQVIANQFLEHPLVVPGEPAIRRDIWTGISGSNLSTLKSHPPFLAGTPSHRGRLTTFETPAGHASNRGQRLAARLVAPESGDFRFWIAADDAAELWLSTDSDPANRVRIGRTTEPTTFRQWDANAEQDSGALPLVAGRTYHIEALHKENVGGGHLSVAWKGPSFPRQVLDGRFLSYIGTQPASVALKREIWTGIGGNDIGNLTGNQAFPNSPNQTDTMMAFSAPDAWGDNYGQRISGYLIAPRTGDYRFWIASDDASELWISSNGSVGSRTRIAWAGGATGKLDWTNFTSQESAVISLIEGQRCYIEALHKEGGGDDYLDVAWEGPGFGREIIRQDFLEYPGLMPGETHPGNPGAPPAGDPGYAFWLDFHDLPAGDRDPEADPDHDEVPNLLEFVLGGRPVGPDSHSAQLLPTLTLDHTWAVFEFRRANVALVGDPFVETATDLGTWTRAIHGAGGIQVAVEDDGFGPGVDRVTVRIPRESTTRFLRLRASAE